MGAVERRLYRDSRVAGVVHLAVGVGGENSYGGVAEDRGRLGDGRPPAPADGARAIRLARHTAIAFAVACATLPKHPTPRELEPIMNVDDALNLKRAAAALRLDEERFDLVAAW